MQFPSFCLRFGPIREQNMTVSQTVTLGTSHYQDQADRLKELKKWEREQEKELKMYGEEVEIVPSPLLLQEKEEAEGRQPTPVSLVSIPGRIRSSFTPTVSATSTSSRRRRYHHKPSSSPTASEPSTSAAAPVRPLSSAATPAAADFPAGFSSRPGRCRHRRTVTNGEGPPWPPRSCWVVILCPLQFSSRQCNLQPKIGCKPGWRK
ncbi:hypothetical protein CRENBAI_016681 [Crenichthys baileyi]|uniref:Uncharacterized protein n=1 Tax=Crenichthys baileyi TaxID=28760 RepID=A0AAV9RJ97_9TELE